MKIIKKIVVGSRVFFSKYEDFHSKDTDIVVIVDSTTTPTDIKHIIEKKKRGEDLFFYCDMNKSEFIKFVLRTKISMKVGQFLVPEFINYINLDISDLPKLKYLIDRLHPHHTYLKIIYDSYIENNGFFLTDEQRDTAYIEYKKTRNLL